MNAIVAWLDRPVDPDRDHVLGPRNAEITLVEYGSYDCPHCRAANEVLTEVRSRFGDRLRYVFRHRPITGSDIAERAAELAERIEDPARFWEAHVGLMSRSAMLTEEDLRAVAAENGIDHDGAGLRNGEAAAERVRQDVDSAERSGVRFTPTFFINRRRYDGPWDLNTLSEALLGTLGHRVRVAALSFASWAPSAGLLLLLGSIIAVLLSNSPLAAAFDSLWKMPLAIRIGGDGLEMSLRHWVNDGLLTIFFLVVALEIKREFTVGHLATRRSAALPVAAAIGGMAVPAGLYALVIPAGEWAHGWGVPIATDTAFAVALIAMMGRRVPVELRIFLTAAAIVDDIGAIVVVALFYAGSLELAWLAAAAAVVGGLALLNKARVYRAAPYMLLGFLLWFCVLGSGVHATLAGVLLALFIPTRPPPDYRALWYQADAILSAEAGHGSEVLRRGPSEPTLQALDAIHERLESPAARTLRHFGPRSSYVVLPLFALANAGVAISGDVLEGRGRLLAAIAVGLAVGKPLGMTLVGWLAVKLGAAVKPEAYSWRQLVGAGALGGIGFTMSLFIAAQAFPLPEDFAAAQIAVFTASIVSAIAGVAILWNANHRP